MSKRLRDYFFQSNPTASGRRLRQYNKPDETLYRNLLDSMPFFDEKGDTASESAQGLVKLGTNANVIARTSANSGSMQTVVRPHQLPLMVGADGTVAGTIDTAVEEGGLKLTPVNNADTNGMDFQIELDPTNLDTVVFDPDNDMVVITDATDSNAPKIADISAFLAGTNLWQRAATTMSPVNANDDVDIGTGDFKGRYILLDGTGNRQITVDDNASGAGGILSIVSGNAADGASDGGDVNIYSGRGEGAGVAGDIYISPTQAGGDVMLGWTIGGVGYGGVGVGCAADSASFILKADGDVQVTGTIQIDTPAATAISSLIGLDASNQVQTNTAIQFQDKLFGSSSKGKILYHDGTEWKQLAVPGSTGQYLKFDYGVTDIPVWASVVGATDALVGIDAAATPGYLGAAYNDGVLRIASYGGLEYTDGGNFVSLGMDIDGLDDIGTNRYSKLSYMAITDPADANATKKVPLMYLNSGKDANWTNLVAGTDFTATPTSTSRIATADLTSYVTNGMAVRFKLDSDASYRYAIVKDVTVTYIDIMGDPLVVAADELTELYIGGYDRVYSEVIMSDVTTNYNANTITTVLDTFVKRVGGYIWKKPEAKLVGFSVIHKTDDGTVQPIVNLRVGATVTDYVSTSNANAGLLVGTTINETVVDIETTKNTVEYGDMIEVKVDKNGGTGDADDIQVSAIFVFTSTLSVAL